MTIHREGSSFLLTVPDKGYFFFASAQEAMNFAIANFPPQPIHWNI